jgi:hypothetical protein
MKIKCGDANPGGNVFMRFKGGCGEELDIRDAYRCTGCGGFFHLDCIFKHFELENKHDYAHNSLRRLAKFIKKRLTDKDVASALRLIKKGLDRMPNKKRIKL